MGRGVYPSSVDELILRITSAEAVGVKILYQNVFNTVLPARLILHGNLIPEFRDSTGAIERRMLLLYTTDAPLGENILAFERVLIQEKQSIVARLILAYRRLLDRGGFILPEYSKAEAQEITQTANSALIWLNTETIRETNPDISKYWDSPELYSLYNFWAKQMGHIPMSSSRWGHEMSNAGFPVIRMTTGERKSKRQIQPINIPAWREALK
jgi:phage/plasmid-associated DNA primase